MRALRESFAEADLHTRMLGAEVFGRISIPISAVMVSETSTYLWMDYARRTGAPYRAAGRFAADLEAQGPKSTKVTLFHSPYMQRTLINAVTEWSKGNDQSCHGYGGHHTRNQ